MRTIALMICLLFITSFAIAGTRIFYSGEDVTGINNGSPVVGALYYSDDSPDYVTKMALIASVPRKFLKVVAGELVERTQAEKAIILQAEADAQAQALLDAIDKYEVSNLDLLTALVKRINVRIPSNPITKQEIMQQIKDDLGL